MLLRILFLLTLLLTLPVRGIDKWYMRRHWPKWVRALCMLPNVLLFVSLACLAVHENYTPQADYWKGMLVGATLCLTVPEAAVALLLGGRQALPGKWRKTGRWAERLAGITGALLFLTMVYGFTLGYRNLHVTHLDFTSSRLPKAFDGYRIVQVSDLHLGTLRAHKDVVRELVEKVNECHADLVVFTGDLVNYRAEEADAFVDILKGMRSRDGVISVTGNHDYAQYYQWESPEDSLADIRHLQNVQRQMGWKLLLNDHVLLHRGGSSIAVIGVENEGLPPFPALADLPQAMQGLPPNIFKILLSHDPTFWRRKVLPATDIDLTLSGHTHGMQFKVGGFSPASWFYDEWGGLYHDGQRALHVSLGAGEVMVPFRLGAWPEINVIELHCK